MAEPTKNKKNLKFEVSAKLDKDKETISIFSTDEDFVGLPFKLNVHPNTATYDSIYSVMKDYEIAETSDLVKITDREESPTRQESIPAFVPYPAKLLEKDYLFPIGVGKNNSTIQADLSRGPLSIKGSKGSGKTVLTNIIVQEAINRGWEIRNILKMPSIPEEISVTTGEKVLFILDLTTLPYSDKNFDLERDMQDKVPDLLEYFRNTNAYALVISGYGMKYVSLRKLPPGEPKHLQNNIRLGNSEKENNKNTSGLANSSHVLVNNEHANEIVQFRVFYTDIKFNS